MTAPVGARLEDWLHFDTVLRVGHDLLPVVPDPLVTPGPYSKVKKFGKIPSTFDREGRANGIPDWTTLDINQGNFQHWSSDRRYSLCLRLGSHSGVYAIDVDVDDFDLCEEIAQLVAENLDPLAEPLPVRSRAGTCKYLLLFRLESPITKIILDWGRRDAAGKPERIEILGEGQQCVVAGSHPSGALYEWNGADNLPWSIPTLTQGELDALVAALAKRFGTSSLTKSATASGSATGVASSAQGEEVLSSISAEELQDLREALSYQPLIDSAAANDVWSEIGYALLSLGTLGFDLWCDFSARAPNLLEQSDPTDWWDAHERQLPRSDYRHIFSLARALGWRLHSDPNSFGIVDVASSSTTVRNILQSHPEAIADPQIPLAQFLCTDLANARRIVVSFGQRLAVVAGSFYHYTGKRWEKNDSAANRSIARLSEIIRGEAQAFYEQFKVLAEEGSAEDPNLKGIIAEYTAIPQISRRGESAAKTKLEGATLGEKIIKAYEAYAELHKWSKQCESTDRQSACRKLLIGMLDTPIERLDTHHYLLNCDNGTIDLRTGEIREHRPDDWITQLAPTRYDPGAQCPGFEKFLEDILDRERAAFLQRWSGYCATGDTREQKVVLHIGPGGNGKGTFFRLVTATLGSYVHTAAPHILTGDAGASRHPTEIADLFGRRFVVSHESDEGAVLREGFMKQASGEDQLAGRYLFKDFFSFTPTFKLQLLTNHKPIVKGQDFGVWRRLLLLNYGVRYGSAEQVRTGEADRIGDEGLTTRLMAEREGILAWIVRGAMDWYRSGLRAPSSIYDASVAYRNEQDRVKQFVAERCIVDPVAWSSFNGPFGLYPEYTRWAKDSGFQALTSTRFIGELERVVPGFRKEQKQVKVDRVWKAQRGCWGVQINVDQDGGGFAVLPDNEASDLL